MFAWAPECGCTLTCSAPNSALRALDRQRLRDVDELAAAVVALARDSLRRTCSSSPSRRLPSPRRLTKFSEAMSSRPSSWRCGPRGGWRPAISGSTDVRLSHRGVIVERGDLVDAALVAAAGKRRVEKRRDDAARHRPGRVSRSPSARTLASLCSRLSRGRRFVEDGRPIGCRGPCWPRWPCRCPSRRTGCRDRSRRPRPTRATPTA